LVKRVQVGVEKEGVGRLNIEGANEGFVNIRT
jgi:hypothetical protein